MAGSRMEKLSTIFKRYTGLINTGAVYKETRPLWYDVYEAFPPATEPVKIRPVSYDNVRNIFYGEDVLRSRVHKEYDESSYVYNFLDAKKQNSGEIFIDNYLKLVSEKGENIDLNNQELFQQTEDILKDKIQLRKKQVHVKDNFIVKTFAPKEN